MTAESSIHPQDARSEVRIGVDVGGTFTDLVASDGRTLWVVKLPSTPPAFHLAVIDAVHRAMAGREGAAAHVVHGSTVATNALLQRAGEPVAFVTTEGFRDMLLIGRQTRPHLYALHVVRPEPLTAERNWFTVRERIDAAGNIVEPLTVAEVDRLIGEIRAAGLRHVAVCLLFSFVNPAHERLIAYRCRAAGLTVSLSSEVLPEFREYERASTTVINASLRPRVEEYLGRLEGLLRGESLRIGEDAGAAGRLRTADFGLRIEEESAPADLDSRPQLDTSNPRVAPGSPALATYLNPQSEIRNPQLDQPDTRAAEPSSARRTLSILHSAGGTLSVADASMHAARLVLSGPAGGVIGAQLVAAAAGFRDVITYDMGGTSTDVATIVDGRPQWTTAGVVDGLPLGAPAFDIVTVGAGGGSIAYQDAGGALRVGPRSAGAVPGPACYGRGGTEPTVTDANLLLGRILPDRFAGGSMRVDPDLARRAIEPLAEKVGKSREATALGICAVAEQNMSRAIRAVTSRRGHDPRRFVLVSFGGAGGLHACALADSLDIPRVLVPPYCGVLSALGMVAAPPVVDVSQTVVHLGDLLDDARLAAEFGRLNGLASDELPNDRMASVEAWADVRFKGQSHEVKVRVERPAWEWIGPAFREAYAKQFGHLPEGKAVQIVTLRLRRIGRTAPVELPTVEPATADPMEMTTMIVAEGVQRTAPVLNRAQLAGRTMPGPLLVIDPEATTYVPPQWSATGHANASVVLERGT